MPEAAERCVWWQMRAGVGDEMLRERWRHASDGRRHSAARADNEDGDSDGFCTPVGSPSTSSKVLHEYSWDGPRTPWMPVAQAGTDTPTDLAVASVSDFCAKIQWLYRSHDRLHALLDGKCTLAVACAHSAVPFSRCAFWHRYDDGEEVAWHGSRSGRGEPAFGACRSIRNRTTLNESAPGPPGASSLN